MEPLTPPPPPSSSTPPPRHSFQTSGFSSQRLESLLEDPRGSFFDRTGAVTTSSSEMPMDRPSGSFGVVGDGGPVDGAVPLGFEYSGGAFHPGSGGSDGFSSHFSRDEEYKKKREKNNEAVRKSRQKTKNRTLETARRVEALKQENDELEQRSKSLTKELKLLKEIFVKQMNQQGGQEEEEGWKFPGAPFVIWTVNRILTIMVINDSISFLPLCLSVLFTSFHNGVFVPSSCELLIIVLSVCPKLKPNVRNRPCYFFDVIMS